LIYKLDVEKKLKLPYILGKVEKFKLNLKQNLGSTNSVLAWMENSILTYILGAGENARVLCSYLQLLDFPCKRESVQTDYLV
jgi:hypothetical protein